MTKSVDKQIIRKQKPRTDHMIVTEPCLSPLASSVLKSVLIPKSSINIFDLPEPPKLKTPTAETVSL